MFPVAPLTPAAPPAAAPPSARRVASGVPDRIHNGPADSAPASTDPWIASILARAADGLPAPATDDAPAAAALQQRIAEQGIDTVLRGVRIGDLTPVQRQALGLALRDQGCNADYLRARLGLAATGPHALYLNRTRVLLDRLLPPQTAAALGDLRRRLQQDHDGGDAGGIASTSDETLRGRFLAEKRRARRTLVEVATRFGYPAGRSIAAYLRCGRRPDEREQVLRMLDGESRGGRRARSRLQESGGAGR